MASVTQCDVCKNVVKHEESKYIEIYNVDKYDNSAGITAKKEICSECYKKIANILNIYKEEN